MEEDIKILDELLNCDFDYEAEITYNDRQAYKNLKNELKRFQQENEELRKGQQSLMQSRKKWKARYYKEKKFREKLEMEYNILLNAKVAIDIGNGES